MVTVSHHFWIGSGNMACKSLYKGVFDFPHRAYVLCRAAYSPEQAKILMSRTIAKQQGTDNMTVLKWLKENKDRYLIKLEIEWKEEDDERG